MPVQTGIFNHASCVWFTRLDVSPRTFNLLSFVMFFNGRAVLSFVLAVFTVAQPVAAVCAPGQIGTSISQSIELQLTMRSGVGIEMVRLPLRAL